jgi:hypothetical protein
VRTETVVRTSDLPSEEQEHDENVVGVEFSVDGESFEIDLYETQAAKLRGILGYYAEHARVVKPPARVKAAKTKADPALPRGSAAAARKKNSAFLTEVRAWARRNGYEVSDYGQVAFEIISAYRRAHELAATPAPAPAPQPASEPEPEQSTPDPTDPFTYASQVAPTVFSAAS